MSELSKHDKEVHLAPHNLNQHNEKPQIGTEFKSSGISQDNVMDLFSCNQCEFDSENEEDLKVHLRRNIHDIRNLNKTFENKDIGQAAPLK